MRPQASALGFSLVGHLRREPLMPNLLDRCLPDLAATRFPAEIVGRDRLPPHRHDLRTGTGFPRELKR